MGAKTSTITQETAGNGQPSGGGNETTMQNFPTLRALPGGVGMIQHQQGQSQSSRVSTDSRQRARSLSSVPDIATEPSSLASSLASVSANVGQVLGLPQLDIDDLDEETSRVVYAAQSLPSHIWSLNGRLNKNSNKQFAN